MTTDRATASRFQQQSPRAGETVWEETVRRYDSCHPNDSFADLVRRASFSKEDRRLMEDWLEAVGRRRRP